MNNSYCSTHKKIVVVKATLLINISKIRHLKTKSINKDGNNINQDDSPLESPNKSPYICTTKQ